MERMDHAYQIIMLTVSRDFYAIIRDKMSKLRVNVEIHPDVIGRH